MNVRLEVNCYVHKHRPKNLVPPHPLKINPRSRHCFTNQCQLGPTPLWVFWFNNFNFRNPDPEWLQYLQDFAPLRLQKHAQTKRVATSGL
jgi:hypothetical protein